MRELVRTNDIVLVSAIEALLKAADIRHVVFDQNMSVLEGSLGVLPRRVLVPDDAFDDARQVMHDAGLAHELRPDGRTPAAPAVTEDDVLGGRLTLRQPKKGHRVGHDAILLAAAVEIAAGDHAVDLGAGVGGAGLALAARCPDVRVTLAEIDDVLCGLARDNICINAMERRVRVLNLDVTASGAFEAAGIAAGSADRVLMNPPFNDPRRQTASPDPARRLAHVAAADTLPLWINTAARLLKPDGALTLIWRAEALAEVLDALTGFGGIGIMPILPKPGADPIRVIVRGCRGSRAGTETFGGLVLNDANGNPSDAAEAVLRGAAPLLFR